ncbi:hypothetical protein BKI49_09435 [Streptomyces sp. Tue6028]|nr:hypothetical protein BKI49_09435 [Streptomyces sp. Tue6028]
MSIIALAFGAISIPQLKQQLLPTIELPMVSVLAPYQGASPDVVEKQVVEPIEDTLEAVDGITGVTSTASEGNAVITLLLVPTLYAMIEIRKERRAEKKAAKRAKKAGVPPRQASEEPEPAQV